MGISSEHLWGSQKKEADDHETASNLLSSDDSVEDHTDTVSEGSSEDEAMLKNQTSSDLQFTDSVGMSTPILNYGMHPSELAGKVDHQFKLKFVHSHAHPSTDNTLKLINFLRDKDPSIRRECVKVLRQFVAEGPSKVRRLAFNALVKMEEDDDSLVRLLVVDAIQKYSKKTDPES